MMMPSIKLDAKWLNEAQHKWKVRLQSKFWFEFQFPFLTICKKQSAWRRHAAEWAITVQNPASSQLSQVFIQRARNPHVKITRLTTYDVWIDAREIRNYIQSKKGTQRDVCAVLLTQFLGQCLPQWTQFSENRAFHIVLEAQLGIARIHPRQRIHTMGILKDFIQSYCTPYLSRFQHPPHTFRL